MITAITSMNTKSNTTSYLITANNVAFKGNPLKLIKDEVRIGGKIKNIITKNELPIAKKPLIAANKGTPDKLVFGPDGLPVPDLIEGGFVHEVSSNALDAASTKAALTGVLSETSHSFDAVTGGIDALTAKADIIDTVTTVVESKSIVTDIIDGISHIIDKLPF